MNFKCHNDIIRGPFFDLFRVLVPGSWSHNTSRPDLLLVVFVLHICIISPPPKNIPPLLCHPLEYLTLNMPPSTLLSVEKSVISDHHHMIYTVLKSTYKKVPSKKIRFRQYKNFSEEHFQIDLINNLCYFIPSEYGELEKVIVTTLDQHTPIKTKIERGNNKQHINKVIRKEIMLRSKLKKIANKTKNQEDIRRYKKQRNLIVNMNRKAKKRLLQKYLPKI